MFLVQDHLVNSMSRQKFLSRFVQSKYRMLSISPHRLTVHHIKSCEHTTGCMLQPLSKEPCSELISLHKHNAFDKLSKTVILGYFKSKSKLMQSLGCFKKLLWVLFPPAIKLPTPLELARKPPETPQMLSVLFLWASQSIKGHIPWKGRVTYLLGK